MKYRIETVQTDEGLYTGSLYEKNEFGKIKEVSCASCNNIFYEDKQDLIDYLKIVAKAAPKQKRPNSRIKYTKEFDSCRVDIFINQYVVIKPLDSDGLNKYNPLYQGFLSDHPEVKEYIDEKLKEMVVGIEEFEA